VLPAWLTRMLDQPPPLKPHVIQQPRQLPGPPVVLEGDEPDPTNGAARIAPHIFKEAKKKGKSDTAAAAIARGQAMNFIHKLGIFKPQPDSSEY
jgi:hypothetical protein